MTHTFESIAKSDKQAKYSGFFKNIDPIEVMVATIEADLDCSGELALYMHVNMESNTKLVAIGPADAKSRFVSEVLPRRSDPLGI